MALEPMRAMEEPAVRLMEFTIPDAPGNYGPLFRLIRTAPSAPAPKDAGPGRRRPRQRPGACGA
ncbi:hypothetical protein D9753_25685 [Streptomyces dangxiongensis]|uniref:Uncharacterized protein n=1 Tax=Streptomyces dangxiongensis TaxID=1442032 RepID=A0A3G2JHD5_9ACTN|nr:hypothetical protein [Streptomyces dangxiongensis]AYN41704.1 hypothetical protein D9753_25685 [Streptomyces dangxiongensis]